MKTLHDDDGGKYQLPEEVLDAFACGAEESDVVLLRPIESRSRDKLLGIGGAKEKRTRCSGTFDGIQIYWCSGGFVLK